MNQGSPAPEPTKRASNSLRRSSTVLVFPTMKSVRMFTPRLRTYSTSRRTIALGSLNSGIPYARTPPQSWSASKMVTSWPRMTRSLATVSPEGPEPTMATFFPVLGAISGISVFPSAASQSARKRSSRPMAIGAPFLPRMHIFSHCSSWGQTRPQTAGKAFVSLIFFTPEPKSRSTMHLMKPGILIPTGQPCRQSGFLHCRQREASETAISVGYPSATSSKFRTRSKGSCFGMCCRSRFSFVFCCFASAIMYAQERDKGTKG